jgi:hypothetical protein
LHGRYPLNLSEVPEERSGLAKNSMLIGESRGLADTRDAMLAEIYDRFSHASTPPT